MFKSNHFLSIGILLSLSLPGINNNPSLTNILPYPIAPANQADSLICYLQTEDGTIINLEHLCGTENQEQDSKNPKNKKISCYFIDENGNPCPIPKAQGDNKSTNILTKL